MVKALALGAQAVMVGRVWLGLGAGGEEGIREMVEILLSGNEEALHGLGRPSVKDLSGEDLVIPGFCSLNTRRELSKVTVHRECGEEGHSC